MTTITKTRKAVATLANQINKKVRNLAVSFCRAWQIVKGKQLIAKIVGVTQGTRQRALQRLTRYDRSTIAVTLERETSNPYDPNAVKVAVNVNGGANYYLGYIPREIAGTVALLLDKGIALGAKFITVTGGMPGLETYGGLIAVEL